MKFKGLVVNKLLVLLLCSKRGESMRIKDILKEKQPGTYSKLHSKKEEKLTEKDIKELMSHSAYKRSSSGAIRQVR